MNTVETFKTAVKSLKSNKVRSTLTMLGIIIGISSVIIISMLGKGSQKSITGDLMDMADKLIEINVQADDEILNKRDYITEEDIESIKEISGVVGIAPEMRTRTRIQTSNKSRGRFNRLGSSNESFLELVNTKLVYGRVFNNEEVKKAKKYILIDDLLAMDKYNRLNVAGEKLEIELRNGKKQSYTVIGVFEHPMKDLMNVFGRGHYMVYIPYKTYQKYVEDTLISSINIAIDDINQKDYISEQIIDYLERKHNKKDIYEVGLSGSMLDSFNKILLTISLMLTGVATISLLVGGIGVMNIMLVTVTERISEIGIRKALGAKKIDILLQFLVESILLTLLGGVIGIALGYFASNIIGDIIGIEPILEYKMIILSVLVSGGIGILFGTYPAKKASDLNPIDALRHE
jgi:putative ABC transport system permease protein